VVVDTPNAKKRIEKEWRSEEEGRSGGELEEE
jgi:hypothetical protein